MSTFANFLPLAYEQQEPRAQQLNRSSSNVHAVESAVSDAPQVLAAVKINGVQIDGALIDSGMSFSLIASLTLAALPERPLVKQFMHRPPNIVGVGGLSARVRNYVQVSVVILYVEVRHPLIVVDELAYLVVIWADVLMHHRANFELGAPDVVQQKLDQCSVCVVERLPDATPRVIVSSVASTCFDTTLPPHTASRVQGRQPPKVFAVLRGTSAARTCNRSVRCSPLCVRYQGATHVLSVVSVSDKPVDLRAGTQSQQSFL